ncbi:unnamed protein product [Arctogadus glacialis]
MHPWILLLCTMATSTSVAETSQSYGDTCERLCACEEKEDVLTVGCEARGIGSLGEVRPVYYPTYHLLLTGNLLSKLSVDDFVAYTGLTVLHLGGNDISEVQPGAFNGLQGLRRLHLDNNKIDALREELFYGLENLEYLQLDYNYITRVEADSFGRLTHLEVLILNDNLISSLPADVFRLVPLTHLDLRGNQLKTLPYSGLLEHMTEVVELQLEENPWNCSCELIALKTWLESISYTALVGDVVCEFPFRLHGRDADELSKQELCPRRAIAEYEMPRLSSDAYQRTPPAAVTSSGIARSSSRPTKGPRQSGKLKSKPTARVPSNKPQNYDLGLNVNCQERKVERISDLNPKPYNPKKMYLTGNYITVVRRSDFIEATGLDLLHLGNNRIAHIRDRAFGDLKHLRRLYLNGNVIERLTGDIFYGLASVQFLYLEYNVIKAVAVDTFRHVPNLQLLFLNNNLLKALPEGAFAGLTLARLNLRNNHLRSLPVGGVLDRLSALVQVDLFENPWDCSCAVLELRRWLEQLGTGTVVNNVICSSPRKLSGEDMRYIKTTNFCPGNASAAAPAVTPPSEEEAFPGSTVTIETPLDSEAPRDAVPLSVLILALLLIFIASVFVAAGLFAAVRKRHRKAQHEQNMSVNACISSLNMEYGLYKKAAIPKVRTSAGHVYEFIPPPAEHAAAHTPVSQPLDTYRDLEGLNGAFLGEVDHEALGSDHGSTATERPVVRRCCGPEDGAYYHRDASETEARGPHCGALPCRHGEQHASARYDADFDARPQCTHPERVQQQTILYCSSAPSTAYAAASEPGRSEYWELKAKLHIDPDYLEVLEKHTTYSQF